MQLWRSLEILSHKQKQEAIDHIYLKSQIHSFASGIEQVHFFHSTLVCMALVKCWYS